MNPPLLLPDREGRILRATVRLARLLLDAHAASVFLASTLDALVLRATSEEDADHLLGITLAPNEGIAGWVFSTGDPAMVSGVTQDPRFSRAATEIGGYLPDVIVAVPILGEREPIGVLEIIDPGEHFRDDLTVIDIVTEIAEQLGDVLQLVRAPTENTVYAAIGEAQAVLDGISRELRRGR